MQRSNPLVLFVMCVCVFLLPVVVVLTASSTNDRTTHEPKASDAHLRGELKAIEQEGTRLLSSGDPSGFKLGDLNQRLDRVEGVARSRLDKINRSPGERGYSLAVRKQAAYKTLVEQGYSPHEAQLTVDAMVEYDMLPDPPRR